MRPLARLPTHETVTITALLISKQLTCAGGRIVGSVRTPVSGTNTQADLRNAYVGEPTREHDYVELRAVHNCASGPA